MIEPKQHATTVLHGVFEMSEIGRICHCGEGSGGNPAAVHLPLDVEAVPGWPMLVATDGSRCTGFGRLQSHLWGLAGGQDVKLGKPHPHGIFPIA